MPVSSQDLDYQCHMSWSFSCSMNWGEIYMIITWVWIPLSGLTPPHCMPVSSQDLHSNVVVLCYVQWFKVRGDCFVDIGDTTDHHCLNFLFIICKFIWIKKNFFCKFLYSFLLETSIHVFKKNKKNLYIHFKRYLNCSSFA